MRFITAALPLLIFIFQSCAPKPFSKSNKEYNKKVADLSNTIKNQPEVLIKTDSSILPGNWVGAVNFGLRKPNFIIIHHTGQKSCEQTLETFTKESSQVSSHYLICKDGTLYQLLNDYLRGWHAGLSKWGNETDVNSSSLGIELDNDGSSPFSEEQIKSLLILLQSLKQKYNIPAANFIGHGDVAPGRKVDPNYLFPWKSLSDKGFGLWYDDTTQLNLPPDFNMISALRIIGYDISDPLMAQRAFRRHFIQIESDGELNEQEKKVLYGVMLKFL